MIAIADRPQLFRIVAIDNGSATMGVSVCDVDVLSGKLHVVHSETFDAYRSKAYGWVAEIHGPRFARYRVLADRLLDVLKEYDPEVVAIESPFLKKRFPESFAVLRETLVIVRQTVMEYSDYLKVELVSPTEAKAAVGVVPDKKRDAKELVREAVLKLNDVIYADGIDPTQLDEHCVDSIAVAYFYKKMLLEGFYGKG